MGFPASCQYHFPPPGRGRKNGGKYVAVLSTPRVARHRRRLAKRLRPGLPSRRDIRQERWQIRRRPRARRCGLTRRPWSPSTDTAYTIMLIFKRVNGRGITWPNWAAQGLPLKKAVCNRGKGPRDAGSLLSRGAGGSVDGWGWIGKRKAARPRDTGIQPGSGTKPDLGVLGAMTQNGATQLLPTTGVEMEMQWPGNLIADTGF